MSMSSCPHCWDDPCVCGHEYKNYSIAQRKELIKATLRGLSLAESVILISSVIQDLLDVPTTIDAPY